MTYWESYRSENTAESDRIQSMTQTITLVLATVLGAIIGYRIGRETTPDVHNITVDQQVED